MLFFSLFFKKLIRKFLTSSFDILINKSLWFKKGDNKYGFGLNNKLDGTSVSSNLL